MASKRGREQENVTPSTKWPRNVDRNRKMSRHPQNGPETWTGTGKCRTVHEMAPKRGQEPPQHSNL